MKKEYKWKTYKRPLFSVSKKKLIAEIDCLRADVERYKEGLNHALERLKELKGE